MLFGKMAVVVAILGASVALILVHAILVVDAALLAGRITGGIASAARFIRSSCTTTSLPAARSSSAARQQQQQQQQPKRGANLTVGSSVVRSLHFKLLAVHATAFLVGGAVVLRYALPVSDTTCEIPHQLFVAFLLINDASLVTFLLAKVDVTNGQRTLACWEKGIIWISRVYAWIYLPCFAVFIASTSEGGASASEEGTFCTGVFDGEDERQKRKDNVRGYVLHNALLIIQFTLLLMLFVRPLLVRHECTQTGGAVYRRVVVRNVVCTGVICSAYLIATVVEGFALLNVSVEDNKASTIADVAPVINLVVVLCLLEISLSLGFTSCWKALFATDSANSHAEERSATGPEVNLPASHCRGSSPHHNSQEALPVEP